MAREPKIGVAAPAFHATAVGGEYGAGRQVSLADFRGSVLILHFYPKDDTPGCTVQACGLRDAWDEIKDRAAVFQSPFPLLSDPEKKMATAYGVWVEKNMYGRKYMGVKRATFVIDGNGRISAIFHKVKPEQHARLLHPVLRANIKK